MFPLIVDLKDKDVLVIGFGRVGKRKIKKLNEYGICPDVFSEGFEGGEDLFFNRVNKLNLKKYLLIIQASNDSKFNEKLKKSLDPKTLYVDCEKKDRSNAFFPASFLKSGISVSFSSFGKFPLLAKELKNSYEKSFSFSEEKLELLDDLRKRTKNREDRYLLLEKGLEMESISSLRELIESLGEGDEA